MSDATQPTVDGETARAWDIHVPQGAGFDLAALTRDGGLPARWLRRWSERPSFRQLRDHDGTWLTSEELQARSRRAARVLLARGLRAGDRVMLSADTSAAFVIAYIGALRAGLIVVPLNTAYTAAEIGVVAQDAQPRAALVDDRARGELIGSLLRPDAPVLDLEQLERPSAAGAGAAAGAAADDGLLDRSGVDDPALLIYTSGTTGRPKGARLTHGNLLASATAVQFAWRWQQADRLLLALPLFHVHGLGVGINGALCAGAEVVLRRQFDVEDVAARAGDGITMFFGVPAMYQRLVAADRVSALSGLRLLVSGSAPLPAMLAERVQAATGQIPLERYGMTETVMLTSNPYAGPRKPGTVGLALPGVRVRLSEGGSGEVQVRGPNVISGYWQRPDADAEAFTPDGWFRTGDLGELDADGYLTLVGRSKELIISGGFNVYPREVEEAIATHPAVREVAVAGRPSERWGEEVTAFVVTAGPVDVQELRAHAAQRLAPYKVPKAVRFVDELPRNALGKIVRHELR